MRRVAFALALSAAIGCKEKQRENPQPVDLIRAVPVAEAPKAEPKLELPRPEAPEPPMPVPSSPDPWLDAPRPPSRPGSPTAEPLAFDLDKLKIPSAPLTIEALVRDVRGVASATAPELVLVKLVGSYVNKSGELDPTYGKVELELQLLDGIDGVVDDPNRPTGAPIREVAPAEKLRSRCPRLTFAENDWAVAETSCYKPRLQGGPRCTVAQIWGKALAQSAPDNAVAIVQFDARNAMWTFRITDKLRGVNFSRSYKDECTTPAPGPTPKVGVKRNPYAP